MDAELRLTTRLPRPPDAEQGRSAYFRGRHELLFRLVRSGAWARLTHAQAKVYFVMFMHADDNLVTWPSAATIAAEAGLSARHVKQLRNELVTAGLVEPTTGGGGRFNARYRILAGGWESPPAMRSPSVSAAGNPRAGASGTPPPAASSGGWGGEPQFTAAVNPSSPLGCSPVHRRGEPQFTAGVNPSSPERTESETNTSSSSLFEVTDAAELLVSRTFDLPDARGLVDKFGPARVREAVANTDYLQRMGEIRKTYRAALVSFLRLGQQVDARVGAAAQKAAAAALAKQRAEDMTRQRRAAEAEAEQERRELEQAFAVLTPEEIERRRLAVLEAMDEAGRRIHERLAPTHPVMRRLICLTAIPEAGRRDARQSEDSA